MAGAEVAHHGAQRGLVVALRRLLTTLSHVPKSGTTGTTAYTGQVEHRFRRKPITRSAQGDHPERSDVRVGGYCFDFSLGVKGAFAFRRDSPWSVSRWAPWTRRSQMASATVASPMTACQAVGSSWLVTSVAVTL